MLEGHKPVRCHLFSIQVFAHLTEKCGLAVTDFAAWRVDISHTGGIGSTYRRLHILKYEG